AESGGTTSTTFTFQVQDSAGRNLDSGSAVEVEFSIVSGPGGGENITPTSATTDAQGRITSNLNAGNSAGVVQIQAQVKGTTITSKPVAVTIHGGFPDADHFTLEPITDTNIEGFDRNGVEITYKARLGDEFSNPVKPGTAVYFETTGGVIEGSDAQNTDATGYVEVILFAGNPRPADGKGVVTATTTDKNGADISKTTPFIFSTSKADITMDFTELELAPGEGQSVGYTVTDLNGNPMASGTTIEIVSSNNFEVSGTTSHTMSNELETGTLITDFDFRIRATDNFSGSEKITVVVTSPSGAVTSNQDLEVSSTGGGVSGPPAEPAALLLNNLQRDAINIAATGGNINTAFTFQVVDSAGRALDSENPVDVNFSITKGPDGGEGISPEMVTTNSTGRATANLFSGNKAGTVMIEASVTRNDGSLITSQPVAVAIHGGFPVQEAFSISPHPDPNLGSSNFPGYDRVGIENVMLLVVGDKFKNPVKPGTAVWVTTDGGIVEGSEVGHTDELGQVEVILQSGNPKPPAGIATVTAQTIDDTGEYIYATTEIIFSTTGADIEVVNDEPLNIPADGTQDFDYNVTDMNGNPMAPGTTIEVVAPERLELMGETEHEYTEGDTKTAFYLIVRDTDSESSAEELSVITIIVTSPDGTITKKDIKGVRHKGAF
ncbi:MAG: hypothetical protein WEA79_09100, partial [Balneolaceae bacterium]